jgi:hypothetical protein
MLFSAPVQFIVTHVNAVLALRGMDDINRTNRIRITTTKRRKIRHGIPQNNRAPPVASLVLLYVVLCVALLQPFVAEAHKCMHDVMTESLSKNHERHQATSQTVDATAAANVRYATSNSGREHGRRLKAGEFTAMRFNLDFGRLSASLPSSSSSNNPSAASAAAAVANEARYMCRGGDAERGKTVLPTDVSLGSAVPCNREDELDERKFALLRDVVADAAKWWSAALSIDPVVGPLVLGRPTQCNDGVAYMCCSGFMPASHYETGKGIPDTDFVLYVTARPSDSSVVAWALTCLSDLRDRPIAAHINVSPRSLQPGHANRNRLFSVALHELAHALGFSKSMYAKYRDVSTGERWGLANVVQAFQEHGQTLTKIVTPAVVAAAVQHYGCSNWLNQGVEVEQFGIVSSGAIGKRAWCVRLG